LEDLEAEHSKLDHLMDAVEHHVQEEGEMFPKIRELFDEDELDQLGQELELAKGTPQRQAV
jgi:hemerythrin superfamily protein